MDKYKPFVEDVVHLKELAKKLEQAEGLDIALDTYYYRFTPSELAWLLASFLESGESQ